MYLTSKNINKFVYAPNTTQFKIFDIKYTEPEIECLKNFNVNTTLTFTNFNDIHLQDLNKFLKSIGDNKPSKIKIMNNIIKKLTNIVLEGFEEQSFWMEIRSSLQHNLYIVIKVYFWSKIYFTPEIIFLLL